MNEYKSLVELYWPKQKYSAINISQCHKTTTDWLGSTGTFLQETAKQERDADQCIEANTLSVTFLVLFYGTWMIITVFTNSPTFLPILKRWIRTTPTHAIALRHFSIILQSAPSSSKLFISSGFFSTDTLYAFLSLLSVRAVYPSVVK